MKAQIVQEQYTGTLRDWLTWMRGREPEPPITYLCVPLRRGRVLKVTTDKKGLNLLAYLAEDFVYGLKTTVVEEVEIDQRTVGYLVAAAKYHEASLKTCRDLLKGR